MDIIQTFYDNMASSYDKLFADWQQTTKEQAVVLNQLFEADGFDKTATVLDCACGIGTQAIGLAGLGYPVTASDISEAELAQAQDRVVGSQVSVRFEKADFRALADVFSQQFDIVICMDNALPHMLSAQDLQAAIESITGTMAPGGIFVASIRDYDSMLLEKPTYSPPHIHKTKKGQRVSFQTWKLEGNHYKLTQYIIDDQESLQIRKFDCEYRTFCREELTQLLLKNGCREIA